MGSKTVAPARAFVCLGAMAGSLARFSFKVYRRPFRVPVRTSRGPWAAREGILLRLDFAAGETRFAEVAPLPEFGTETIAGALAWCATQQGPVDLSHWRGMPRGLPACAAAINMLVDPCPYPKSGHTAITALLPAGPLAVDALARAADGGFTTFKLKIGTMGFADELAVVRRVVERLPSGGRLRLDANGGFDVRTATHWLDRLTDPRIEFVEQPLARDAGEELVQLAGDYSTPLALDESVRDADDIKRWRDRGWPGVFVIKPAIAGDHTTLQRELRIEPERFVYSSALETAIGASHALRLAFAAGNTRAVGFGVAGFFPADGLGGGAPQPFISSAELAAWDLEAVWKQL